MKLLFSKTPSKNAVLIRPVFEKEKIKESFLAKITAELTKTKEFSAKSGEIFPLFGRIKNALGRIVLLGMGNEKKLKIAQIMEAFGSAVKFSGAHNPKNLALILGYKLYPFAQSIAEAVMLADYQPGISYKTGKALQKIKRKRIEILEIIGAADDKKIRQAVQKGLLLGSIANEVRDWVNAPPNIANAKFFDDKAAEIAKTTGSKLVILKKKELEKLGMNALLSVNRGSPDEARLIILDYCPKDSDPNQTPVVLAGKGLIFDSGGYKLKPHGYIEDMQSDKAGASALLGLVKFLPKLNIKRRIVCVMPFTENLIGSCALKPSEIIKTHSGKTVEVTNTDGEGRLILADAISYAVEKYKPEFLIDIATLTGACVVALGDRYAGLFGNDKNLMESLQKAGEETDELLWPMPLHKNHSEKMKGYYADLRNADLGSERQAGASKGAAFLKEFIGKTKWAHIDIAGPAFTEDPKKYEHKGATGFGLRVLAKFLEKFN